MEEELSLRSRAVLFVSIFTGSIVALSVIGPEIGLTREYGLPIWAVCMLVLVHLMFFRLLTEYMSMRKLIAIELLLVGVGLLFYLSPESLIDIVNFIEP